MQPQPTESPDVAALKARLAEVEIREAAFRATSAQDFLELRKALKLQKTTLDETLETLRRRETALHQAHLDLQKIRSVQHERTVDLEFFARRLADVERQYQQLEKHFYSQQQTWAWHFSKPLRWLQKSLQPKKSNLSEPVSGASPPKDFVYYLHTTPFQVFRRPHITLTGWGFPEDKTAVLAIRARVNDVLFVGNYGLPEPEVSSRYQIEKHPGFAIELALPQGRSFLSIEAQLEKQGWVSFLTAPLWSQFKAD